MDTFFTILKKSLIASIFIVFTLVGTYIPQNWNRVEVAEAAPSTFAGQMLELGELALIEIQAAATAASSAASAASEAASEFYNSENWVKEYVLDPAAWFLAKQAVRAMLDSLLVWINNGFSGSPMFVQDLQGFLLNTADSAMGEYLGELTGTGSFLCSPFRLDIGVALATKYQRSRVNKPKTCNLSDIVGNIEDFTSGAKDSFSQGGWDNWIKISSNPEMYTPYGAYLSAEATADIELTNAKGEQISLLNFGDGFLSGEKCDPIVGSTKQNCYITTPGKTLEEALSFNIDGERQSLISADEIDEVLGALFGELFNQAMTKGAGILGIGGAVSTGKITGAPGSFTNTVIASSGNDALIISTMQNERAILKDYNTTATTWRNILLAYANDPTNPPAKQVAAANAAADALNIMSFTSNAISELNTWIADYVDSTTTVAKKANIYNTFSTTADYAITDADIDADVASWNAIIH